MALQLVRNECLQTEESSRIETSMVPLNIQTKRQTELNSLQSAQQTEFLRSTQLAQAIVDAESKVKAAEAAAQVRRAARSDAKTP